MYNFLIRTSIFLLFIIFAFCPVMAEEREYGIDDVPAVHIDDAERFVSDPDGIMSAEARSEVDARLRRLMDDTGAEMAVVVLPSIGNDDPFDFGVRLFEKWKPGKKDTDNGLLMLVVMDQRQAKVITGYGLEGILPDADVTRIARATMTEKMKAGDVDGAIADAANAYAAIISEPENAAEIKSKYANDAVAATDSEDLKQILFGFAALVFAFATVAFFINAWQLRKRDNHTKAVNWKSLISMFGVLAVLSLGAGLIWFVIALILSRRYRNKPRKCPVCSHKMKKLSEEEDNTLLNAAQDLEERLGSVDYDVWVCPECNAVERLPYSIPQSKYSRCEKCGTMARHLVSDSVVLPATTSHAGRGVRRYHCEYCGNDDNINYTIPRKVNTGAVVAGAALGGALSGRGGGGFSGGSFGGGMTGGGGGGASW